MKLRYTRLHDVRRGPALLIAASALAATGAVVGAAGAASAFPPVAIGPVPPPNLHVTTDGFLTWEDAPGATYYYVWRDGQLIATENGGNTGYAYADSATQGDGKAHTYKVSEYNPSFPTQRPSSTVTEPPVNLADSLGSLCWDPVAGHTNSTDGYLITLDGTTYSTSGWPCSLGLDSYGLIPGRQYTSQVASASSASGSAERDSDWGQARAFTFEPQPTGFQAAANSTGVHLSWQQTPGAFFYKVYRGNTLIASSIAATSYDYKIPSGTAACYTVTSYYAGATQAPGESQPSQVSCATAG